MATGYLASVSSLKTCLASPTVRNAAPSGVSEHCTTTGRRAQTWRDMIPSSSGSCRRWERPERMAGPVRWYILIRLLAVVYCNYELGTCITKPMKGDSTLTAIVNRFKGPVLPGKNKVLLIKPPAGRRSTPWLPRRRGLFAVVSPQRNVGR